MRRRTKSDQLQMILDRPARSREPGPASESLNHEEICPETRCKDSGLCALVIMAGR